MLARAARHALAFKPSRPPFRFRGCLHYPPAPSAPQYRLAARAASTAAAPPSTDDLELVTVFDQPTSTHRPSAFSQTGLFGEDALKSPATFRALADATLKRAALITDRILRAHESRWELARVVKNLDRLSDMLCGIIDLAELVRNAHPDRAWIECADEVYDKLCEYMNTLNVNVGLYEVLRHVLNDAEIVSTLSEEAHQTALIFWRDFEKHGIHLPDAERQAVVDTSQAILALGRQFLTDSGSTRPPASIKLSELEGMKDSHQGAKLQLQARFSKRELLVYPGSLQAQMIMRSAPTEEPRRKVYVAANSSTPQQLEVLEYLLRARAQLARLLGQDSYSRVALSDKMAKSPENVVSFLDTLMEHTKPHARSALQTLAQRKQAHLGTAQLPVIQAWDRDYYCPPEPPAPPFSLPPLTLGTVFMGLSRLFQHLYGVSLRPASVQAGEAWHTDVRKLEVVDEDSGVVGWIYADLFTRAGKPSGAAHYTVRCSRRVDDDEAGADHATRRDYDTDDPALQFGHTQRRAVRGQDGIFQLPVVVLLCDFARPTLSRGATVIEWHDVTTLFHEMGHAMHSMIGRTEYQNVSGTRCATDVVELPSILMEHFLSSPAVLSLFSTDPGRAVAQVGNHHQDPCRSIDTHTQVLIAMLDQLYHSPAALGADFDTTAALAGLQADRGLIPHVEGTSWQTQFGHLFGYGATYYSYLFDRAIAARVWRDVFARDPLSRTAGEKYKHELLKFGGGRDPWQMVAGLLDVPELAAGDAEAMREVGRWRIEDEVSFGRH